MLLLLILRFLQLTHSVRLLITVTVIVFVYVTWYLFVLLTTVFVALFLIP
jgi:hypothetical protein